MGNLISKIKLNLKTILVLINFNTMKIHLLKRTYIILNNYNKSTLIDYLKIY
jgi:hypothetical protein